MCILGSLNPLKGASAGRWVSPPERKSQPHREHVGQNPGKNRSQWRHRKQRPQLLLSAPCRHQPAESSRRFKKRDGRRLRRSRRGRCRAEGACCVCGGRLQSSKLRDSRPNKTLPLNMFSKVRSQPLARLLRSINEPNHLTLLTATCIVPFGLATTKSGVSVTSM